ncbi:YdcF family protein [Vibrio sp. CAU 1672]|uniref:YdcF family protein n=1 Tax=Vibrio sp. CAU 1672 TaxID=3032594 RepID=UPI0023D9D9AE|nr:YdcF family protein [Vibrio sp. CAU 1672]MDF2152575.1 YdcF family protein [Vibrio sp. CAU 1672]
MQVNHVVIVLGKRLVHGELTAEGRSRVQALVELLPQLPLEQTAVVFCGGITPDQLYAEADRMLEYYQQLVSENGIGFNLPERHILLENRSLNTVQNIQNAAAELLRSGLCLPGEAIRVTLLSNDYHLQRIIEIQTLMDEQGLLRTLKQYCQRAGLQLEIPLDISEHCSVPYPHRGERAQAFLHLDELTTYRVYLEGIVSGVFQRDLAEVKAGPFAVAIRAVAALERLPLEEEEQAAIAQMKQAIEWTADDDSREAAQQALTSLHPILTALNQRLDPEAIA